MSRPRAAPLLALALAALAALAALPACDRASPLASCSDDLGGVWRDGAGRRWALLDGGATLQAYPMFDDARPPGQTIAGVPAAQLAIAPRVIELARRPSGLGGTVRRRYMRRADTCEARGDVEISRCAGETLELVVAAPAAPLAFAPCRWPRAAPAHVERWRRE